MQEFAPFCGLRYNPDKIFDLSRVVSVPYDQIGPELSEIYHSRHPNHYVRLILGKTSPLDFTFSNAHTRARDLLRSWRAEGILIQDTIPSFYLYEQDFPLPQGGKLVRKGIIGRLKLRPQETGKSILPHERTFPKPIEERLGLMKETRSNLEHVFLLHRLPEDSICDTAKGKLLYSFQDADYGAMNRLFQVSDPSAVKKIAEMLRPETLLIADGHHRYQTSLSYLEWKKKGDCSSSEDPFSYRLVTLVSHTSPGLLILPTHRVLRPLPGFSWDAFLARLHSTFLIEEIEFAHLRDMGDLPAWTRGSPAWDAAPVIEALASHRDLPVVGLLSPERGYLLRLKDASLLDRFSEHSPEYRKLPVFILHRLILEEILGISADKEAGIGRILYLRSPGEALAMVREGKAQSAFLLPPVTAETVFKLAERGERMPQKSTDFYPKILSGLVAYPFDEAQAQGEKETAASEKAGSRA